MGKFYVRTATDLPSELRDICILILRSLRVCPRNIEPYTRNKEVLCN